MQDSMGNIGGRIKKLRTAKGMTLKEMVEYTGLSIGYLSNLERNATSPTLSALANICDALDTNLVDLLSVRVKNNVVLHRDEMRHQDYPQQQMTSDRIEFGDSRLEAQFVTIQPGEPEEIFSWRHSYAEIGTVLKGKMTVTLDGADYHLQPGESIAVEAKRKHSLRNDGEEECVSYWAHCKGGN